MRKANFITMGLDAWMLALDAGAVIGQRLVRFSTFNSATLAEAQRMVGEKLGSSPK